jgi:hypothetical protein
MEEKVIGLKIETLDYFDQPGFEGLNRDEQIERLRAGVAVTVGPEPGAVQTWRVMQTLWRTKSLVGWLLEQSEKGATIVGWSVDCDLRVAWQNAVIPARVAVDLDTPYQMMATCAMGEEIERVTLMNRHGSTRQGIIRSGRIYTLNEVAEYNLTDNLSGYHDLMRSGDGEDVEWIQRRSVAKWLRSDDPPLVQRATDYCHQSVVLALRLYDIARNVGVLLPPRPERGEQGELRYFVRDDGTSYIEVVE